MDNNMKRNYYLLAVLCIKLFERKMPSKSLFSYSVYDYNRNIKMVILVTFIETIRL